MAASARDPLERPLKKVKFSSNVSVKEFEAYQAADTFKFHLLNGSTAGELEKEIQAGGQPFHCEFYNQVFGESEEIHGYKGLQVDVWLSVSGFHCWVDVRWEDKRAGADDVVSLLREWWPEPFCTDKQEFLQIAAAAPAHDFGQLGEPLLDRGNEEGQQVSLYHKRLTETPDWFKKLHSRMQPLLIFTIDGANFIDTDDPKWEVITAVMKQQSGRQHMIGFMMMYNFYAWPLNERPRVSQVFVLPPLQGAGYGKAMVKAAYELARQRGAVDLTLEDPAPGLQRLREKLEVEMLLSQPWVVEAAAAALAAAEAEEQRQLAAAKQLWQAMEKSRQQQGAASMQLPGTATAGGSDGVAGTSTAAGANGSSTDVCAAKQGRSPASLLCMPLQLQQRVTKELKIHKHQVHAVWEALLFIQAAGCLSSGHSLADALQEFVLARIEASTSPMADRHAARKRMVAVQDKAEDWFVYKVPRKQQAAAGAELDGFGPMCDTVNTGRRSMTEMNAEDWGNRLQELAGERMEQLIALKEKLKPLGVKA